MAINPVCKMNVEPEKAAKKMDYDGQVYYFCSDICHKAFVAEPGKYTSGAAPADIARSMVMRYGMHEKLGHVAYEAERPAFIQAPGSMPGAREYSEETASEIDRAVRTIVQDAFDQAVATLKARRDTLDRGARRAALSTEALCPA